MRLIRLLLIPLARLSLVWLSLVWLPLVWLPLARLSLFWLPALLTAAPSHASESLAALYEQGDYKSVIAKGLKQKDSMSLTYACRAALVEGGFHSKGTEAIDLLHIAAKACQDAITQDPENRTARLSFAFATGFEGKRLKSPSLAKSARSQIEKLIAEDPNDPLSLAALGGWHSEVASAGALARLFLGARFDKAEAAYKAALALQNNGQDPKNNLSMHLEYAKFLAKRGPEQRAEAALILKEIATLKAQDAFEQEMQQFAHSLANALQKGPKAIEATIKQISPFPNIEDQKKRPKNALFKDLP